MQILASKCDVLLLIWPLCGLKKIVMTYTHAILILLFRAFQRFVIPSEIRFVIISARVATTTNKI